MNGSSSDWLSQVVGKGVLGSVGVVMSINEQEGIATVKFPSCDYRKTCKASDVLTVPISRLCTPRSEALPLYKLSITEKVVQAVQSMLLPQEGSLSIHTSLPASGDGSSPVMAAVRLLAEIRTRPWMCLSLTECCAAPCRACLVMAQLLEDSSFCEEFIQQCPAAVEVLNLVAQECSPAVRPWSRRRYSLTPQCALLCSERLGVVEAQCERVRMLYRDCARPPPPPLQTDRRQVSAPHPHPYRPIGDRSVHPTPTPIDRQETGQCTPPSPLQTDRRQVSAPHPHPYRPTGDRSVPPTPTPTDRQETGQCTPPPPLQTDRRQVSAPTPTDRQETDRQETGQCTPPPPLQTNRRQVSAPTPTPTDRQETGQCTPPPPLQTDRRQTDRRQVSAPHPHPYRPTGDRLVPPTPTPTDRQETDQQEIGQCTPPPPLQTDRRLVSAPHPHPYRPTGDRSVPPTPTDRQETDRQETGQCIPPPPLQTDRRQVSAPHPQPYRPTGDRLVPPTPHRPTDQLTEETDRQETGECPPPPPLQTEETGDTPPYRPRRQTDRRQVNAPHPHPYRPPGDRPIGDRLVPPTPTDRQETDRQEIGQCPPPPPLQTDRRQVSAPHPHPYKLTGDSNAHGAPLPVSLQPKEITWCPSRVFPPVRACMFSSRLTSVTFLADPSAGGGLPRGTFIYATSPVPIQAPSFYWEIEIVSYGDSDDDSGPIVSFGFATEAEKRDGAWTNPVGTCLFHNNGRAVHYNGSSLLQWKSVRLDVALLPDPPMPLTLLYRPCALNTALQTLRPLTLPYRPPHALNTALQTLRP
ncbi:hypothetical protein JZ751_023823 [Albula glossodonta]|uniref:Uncharacterized protein n=1 Tax=Albula glossodonta TaxID=121402 RepID=A0A8T2MYP0_9TELE|nr:hypothetical protein JZ751_023823 [Albula glossodonta]